MLKKNWKMWKKIRKNCKIFQNFEKVVFFQNFEKVALFHKNPEMMTANHYAGQ